MAEVACFCGSQFSFDGDARACPRCGEIASLRAGRGPEARESGEAAISLVNMTAAWSGGQPAGSWSGLDLVTVAGLGALAGSTGDIRQRR